MYPKLVDQITTGIAKVVQKATDSQAFHEFPECSVLGHTNRLSIKLKDEQCHRLLMLSSWRPDPARPNSVSFAVRDEDNRKRQLLSAQLSPGYGLVLKNAAERTIMLVRLPTHTADSLGKLLHPSGATMYKLMRDSNGPNYCLVRASSEEEIVMRVEKVFISLHSVGKAVGLLGTNCVYWLKASDGQTVLGHIRPKLVRKASGNTLVVKFMSTQKDVQMRATMLGVALLLLVAEVYPQLRALLAESLQQQH